MGVSWDKHRGKWLVGIRHKGSRVFLGRYNNIEIASVIANRGYVLEANGINPKFLMK